jgi:hypothetical protein
MKISIAVAAFIGLIQATSIEQSWSPKNVDGAPQHQQAMQMESESDSSDSDSDEENIMFPVHNAWESVAGGAEDGHYERVVTPNFSADSDDLFMRSMISNYAVEERTKFVTEEDGTKTGGEPTGRFWMPKNEAMKAGNEVLGTHKGLAGAELSAYMGTYFQRTWEHFDVNGGGSIEVIKMPQFMRMLCSDQTMSLGES